MPYTIRKDGNRYCVYKLGANDTITGKPLGCHDTQAEAGAQIGAIERSEMMQKDYNVINKGMLYPQAMVNYQTVSPETGSRQCANCRWFVPGTPEHECGCHIMEGYPKPVLPTGWCNVWQMEPLPDGTEPIEIEVEIEIDDLTKHYYLYSEPVTDSGIVDRIKSLFKHDLETGAEIVKSASEGLRTAILVSSNGFKDREKQHIATAALLKHVETAYDEDGNYIADNVVNYGHDRRLPIGDVLAVGAINGFLVEYVQERDTLIAKALWDYWQTTSENGEIQWGVSSEFLAPKDEAKNEVVQNVVKRGTAVMPVSGAANVYTISQVIG